MSVALGVVPLDMLELGRVAEGLDIPVEITHPPVKERVSRTDIAYVRLEMLHVDGLCSCQ